jgi:hypothetical protein
MQQGSTKTLVNNSGREVIVFSEPSEGSSEVSFVAPCACARGREVLVNGEVWLQTADGWCQTEAKWTVIVLPSDGDSSYYFSSCDLDVKHVMDSSTPQARSIPKHSVFECVGHALTADKELWFRLPEDECGSRQWVRPHGSDGGLLVAPTVAPGPDDRYYRNALTVAVNRGELPVREAPSLDMEPYAAMPAGAVAKASSRLLNRQGQMWINLTHEITEGWSGAAGADGAWVIERGKTVGDLVVAPCPGPEEGPLYYRNVFTKGAVAVRSKLGRTDSKQVGKVPFGRVLEVRERRVCPRGHVWLFWKGGGGWVLEVHPETSERVCVPVGPPGLFTAPAHPGRLQPRCYRAVHSDGMLPVWRFPPDEPPVRGGGRKHGEMRCGDAFACTERVLGEGGEMWLRLANDGAGGGGGGGGEGGLWVAESLDGIHSAAVELEGVWCGADQGTEDAADNGAPGPQGAWGAGAVEKGGAQGVGAGASEGAGDGAQASAAEEAERMEEVGGAAAGWQDGSNGAAAAGAALQQQASAAEEGTRAANRVLPPLLPPLLPPPPVSASGLVPPPGSAPGSAAPPPQQPVVSPRQAARDARHANSRALRQARHTRPPFTPEDFYTDTH